MRMKYPNLVTGALSASAPLYWSTGHGDRNGFWKSVTEIFGSHSAACVDRVREGFKETARWCWLCFVIACGAGVLKVTFCLVTIGKAEIGLNELPKLHIFFISRLGLHYFEHGPSNLVFCELFVSRSGSTEYWKNATLAVNCLVLDSSILTLDSALMYRRHLESISKNLTSHFALLRRIAGSSWGAG